jgi:predicted cobalt transporter CbtA
MRGFGALLVRGLIAGLFAGLLAGTFAYVVGEPRIDAAIAIEEAGHSHDHEDAPLVSRDGQRAGLFLATSLYGAALGGLFATGFTLLRRRFRTAGDSRVALVLAAMAYAGIVLVPFLKYPPNPPAVGNPDTITERTVSYLLAIVLGLLAVWLAVWLARRVPGRAEWMRIAAGLAGFVAVVVAAYLVLPVINEVPANFPATLLWRFRLASLGTQTILWTLLGIGFAAALEPRRIRSADPVPSVA